MFSASSTSLLIAGTNHVSFRDISNVSNGTITITGKVTDNNKELVITVHDDSANVNLLAADVVTSSATSTTSGVDFATANLTETGNSTGIFEGSISLSSNPTSGNNLEINPIEEFSIFYSDSPPDHDTDKVDSAESQAVAHLEMWIEGVSGPGSVTFTDYFIDSTSKSDRLCPYQVVLHPVDVQLNGVTGSKITLTISYENGLMDGLDGSDLQMLYRKDPFTGLLPLTDDFYHNATAKTITASKDKMTLSPILSGQYTLGTNIGCSGGGGGGLVRPSLVVNALAGLTSGSGGGSAYSSPTLQLGNLVQLGQIEVPQEIEQMILNHDSNSPVSPLPLNYFDDFDYPLTINENGFVLSGYSTTLETQTLKTNTPHTLKFVFYETEAIQHFSLYTNLRDANTEIHQSDTQILYNANDELEIIDPHQIFGNVTLSLNEIDDIKKEIVLQITFDNPMDTSDVIIRAWDPYLNSYDTYILDAIKVEPEEIVESPTPSFEEPIIEQLQSTTIPIWIKNNASWWSDEQISDEDFVAGIEYLISNGIIHVPGVELGENPTTVIPDWIKNNAGWWADSLISDDDFTEAMQWLVVNGVIQI